MTTPLLSVKSKLRILSEPFGHSQPPATEETVSDFVMRKFGREILDYLVDPIVSTIFLGDAQKMGMESAFPALVRWERASGSLARGALAARKSKPQAPKSPGSSEKGPGARLKVTDSLPSLGSFRQGMGTLTDALAERLGDNIRFGTRAESVLSASESGQAGPLWRVRLEGGEEFLAENVVISVAAFEAARLLKEAARDLSTLLDAIPYSPISIVSAGYDRSSVRHPLDGFGFMVPRGEGLKTICTFWNSSLFADRAPAGKVLITSYLRDLSDDTRRDISDDAIAKTALAETEKILGATGKSIERQVSRHRQALPQYNRGHAERVVAIRTALAAFPNLQLAGNYLEGRSIGECAEMGLRAAESIRSHFRE